MSAALSLTGIVIALWSFPAAAEDPPSLLPLESQAWSAWQDGNFPHARDLWLKAAKAGDVIAQYNLGVLYAEGRGVVRNPDAAKDWWQLAAKHGHQGARYNLALMDLGREALTPGTVAPERNGAAWQAIEVLAEEDYAPAQLLVADNIIRSQTTSPSDEAASHAAALLLSAAEAGLVDAQYRLALCHLKYCPGFVSDSREGLAWLSMAARHGNPRAQAHLASFYEAGFLVNRDLIEARAWTELALRNRLAEARQRQAGLDNQMTEEEIELAIMRADDLATDDPAR